MTRAIALPLLLAACFVDIGSLPGGPPDTTGTPDDPHASHGSPPDDPAGTTTEASTGDEPGASSVATTADASTGLADDGACALYCGTIVAACVGDVAQYPGAETCLHACRALPPGLPGDLAGNSLACRRAHAGLAVDDPAAHCAHAGPGGAGVCGSNCEGFCAIATVTCPEEHPDRDACLAACAGFADVEPYDIGDAAGDTLACRLYHLVVAAADPQAALAHCPHTTAASPPCQ